MAIIISFETMRTLTDLLIMPFSVRMFSVLLLHTPSVTLCVVWCVIHDLLLMVLILCIFVAATTQSMRVPNSANHHLKENTPGSGAGSVRVKPSAPSPNHEKALHPKIDPWDTNQVMSPS